MQTDERTDGRAIYDGNSARRRPSFGNKSERNSNSSNKHWTKFKVSKKLKWNPTFKQHSARSGTFHKFRKKRKNFPQRRLWMLKIPILLQFSLKWFFFSQKIEFLNDNFSMAKNLRPPSLSGTTPQHRRCGETRLKGVRTAKVFAWPVPLITADPARQRHRR